MNVQLIPAKKRKGKKFTPRRQLQEWELTGNGVAVAEKHQIHLQTYRTYALI